MHHGYTVNNKGGIMNQKQIQTFGLEYITMKVAEVRNDVNASQYGIKEDEIDTFMGWFSTFEDFKEWIVNESNWDKETCVHAYEIFEFVKRLMNC
jgi:hypothetical protein